MASEQNAKHENLDALYEEATRRALYDEEESRSGRNVMDYSMYVDDWRFGE